MSDTPWGRKQAAKLAGLKSKQAEAPVKKKAKKKTSKKAG
jgi:hypothetical protein